MTPEQQMEQFSLAYVRAVAAAAGVNCTKPEVDEASVDLVLSRAEVDGQPEAPLVKLQVKCHAAAGPGGAAFPYPLKVKNYNDLRGRRLNPKLLVVGLVPDDPADWLSQDHAALVLRRCGYWVSLANAPTTTNSSSVTVQVPAAQVFTPAAVLGFFEGRA